VSDAFAAEGERLARLDELAQKYARETTAAVAVRSASEICAALYQFMECVRYLNTRRSDTSLQLDSEAAVQDAVFLTLRLWIPDLVPESPTDRVGSRFTIKDFRSVSARSIIEVKYIRDHDHGRTVSREMHDDIETYRSDANCDHLIFFVYDPDVHIPDRAALQRQIEVERQYGNRHLQCRLIVLP
jgi:hypothetical protein